MRPLSLTSFAPPVALLATLLLTLSAAAADPAQSTVLGTCAGTSGEQKETKTAAFILRAETSLKVAYEITANPADATIDVVARLQRKLPNGSFVTIKTLADLSGTDKTETKSYPAGEYRLEVTAARANFKVTAEKD